MIRDIVLQWLWWNSSPIVPGRTGPQIPNWCWFLKDESSYQKPCDLVHTWQLRNILVVKPHKLFILITDPKGDKYLVFDFLSFNCLSSFLSRTILLKFAWLLVILLNLFNENYAWLLFKNVDFDFKAVLRGLGKFWLCYLFEFLI